MMNKIQYLASKQYSNSAYGDKKRRRSPSDHAERNNRSPHDYYHRNYSSEYKKRSPRDSEDKDRSSDLHRSRDYYRFQSKDNWRNRKGKFSSVDLEASQRSSQELESASNGDILAKTDRKKSPNMVESAPQVEVLSPSELPSRYSKEEFYN
jgi:hypothetical protein